MRIDLTSTKLAFVLIALLLAHILLSAIIPQRDLAENQIIDWRHHLGDAYRVIEILRLDRIYTAWPFHVLLGLLGVNLLAGNVKRFRQVYRVERTLLRARYLGSIVFHLSLLLVLTGAISNYLFKFQGVFALTEGQSAADDRRSYFRTFEGPLFRSDLGRFEFEIVSIDPDHRVQDALTEAAEIRLSPADGSMPLDAEILVNRPLRWRELEFHLGALVGYSPELQFADASGSTTFRSFVRVAVNEHEDGVRHADFLELADGTTVHLEVLEGETAPSVSLELLRSGESVGSAELQVGDSVALEDRVLSVPRLRHWAFIEVRQNPYLHLVFIGFWAALGGLTITLIPRVWNPRKGS